MSYDFTMSMEWEFWWDLAGNPQVLMPKSKFYQDWSIMGQIGPIKKVE